MLKAFFLLLLAVVQVKMIYTGEILYYLAPQMLPFFYFSTFSFLFLSAYKAMLILLQNELQKNDPCECGCSEGHESVWGKPVMYALFTIPLALGFFMPPKLLDSALVEKKGIIYQQVAPRSADHDPDERKAAQDQTIDHEWWEDYEFESSKSDLPEEQQTLKDELGIWYEPDHYQQLTEALLEQEVIIVDDRGFLDIMLVISAYQDKFQGREVELSGFVYRDMAMSENELAVTRTAITCCLADASFYGILIRGDGLNVFPTDSWIKVRGIIDQDLVFDQNMLMINSIETQAIETPESPYVYPYLYRQYMP
ncbi:MAG: TIGR03943 family protein [Desulfonatronovibrio sp. MSAO_Bac4]|nr:MAG: TIGR03943 family protein [Desulfonatronovibrio sp. MSAO_Bac4]